MPGDAARALVDELLSRWIDGTLDVVALTGGAPLEPAVHPVWDALHEDGLAPFEIERMPPSDIDWPTRWAWTPRWILLSEDQDLFLFGHGSELLRAAADPACPRRDIAISIAVHDVRDQAYAWATGQKPREDPFALATKLTPLARAAGATDATAYFGRLVGYTARGKVDHDAALARAFDLHRCHPPRRDDVEVKIAGDEWSVGYLERLRPSPAFFVHRKTGAIRAATPPER